MFIIKCSQCGQEQNWCDGVTLGENTVIEVADKAVYCECGSAVEEIKGTLVPLTHGEPSKDTTIPASISKRELLQ